MTILIETDAIGGVWTFSLTLARGLRELGHHIHLAVEGPQLGNKVADAEAAGEVESDPTRGLGKTRWRQAVDAVGEANLHLRQAPLEWQVPAAPDGLTLDAAQRAHWQAVDAAGRWLQQTAQQIGADVVQLCTYRHAAKWRSIPRSTHTADSPPPEGPGATTCTPPAPRTPRPPAVVLTAHSDVASWWQAVHESPPPPAYDIYLEGVRAGLAAADQRVMLTAAQVDALQDAGLLDEDADTSVIYNGVDFLNSSVSDQSERNRRGVLVVGRLDDAAKNAAVLRSAALTLGRDLTLVGLDERQAATMGLASATATGWLPPSEVAAVLGHARVFAAPALYEPFGLAAVEAARAGCALVLADLPTYRELWFDAAIYVDPRDPDAWARTLTTLHKDPLRTIEHAQRAEHRAQRFNHRIMARKYQEIYAASAGKQSAQAGKSATVSVAALQGAVG